MSDQVADHTTRIAEQLDIHRWKSMGVASVECECGEILYGDESLTLFPADETFRRHVAEAILGVLPEAEVTEEWGVQFPPGHFRHDGIEPYPHHARAHVAFGAHRAHGGKIFRRFRTRYAEHVTEWEAVDE